MKKRYFTLYVLFSLLLFMNSPSRTSLGANPLTIPSIHSSANTHDPIFIDENDGIHDWGNCSVATGSGTVEDPYLIQDLEIDANGAGSGIFINNSRVYVVIENCTVKNAGSSNTGGIRLINCANITIKSCEISDNGFDGIFVHNSTNITLSYNQISNNNNTGIFLGDSDFSLLEHNRVSDNSYTGIYLINSDFSALAYNKIFNNSNTGICLLNSDFCLLDYNTVSNNTGNGIYLENSDQNAAIMNYILYNTEFGIFCNFNSHLNDFQENFIFHNNAEVSTQQFEDVNSDNTWEKNVFDPNSDVDADGLTNIEEIEQFWTDPMDSDSDSDGYTDGQEIAAGTNPLDANSHPIDTRDPVTWTGGSTPFRNWPAIYAGVGIAVVVLIYMLIKNKRS